MHIISRKANRIVDNKKLMYALLFLAVGFCFGKFSLRVDLTELIVVCLGLITIIFVFMRNEFGVILIIFLTSTIFASGALPTVSINRFIPDLLPYYFVIEFSLFFTLILLLSIVIRNMVIDQLVFPKTLIMVPLIILLFVMFLSSLFAVLYGGVELHGQIVEGRRFLLYLFYFVVIASIDNKKKLKFVLNTLIVLALLSSMLTIAQYIVGSDFTFFLGNRRVVRMESFKEGVGARIITPGLALAFTMFPLSFIFSLRSNIFRLRLIYLIVSIVLLANIIISMYRNLWVGAAIAVLLLWTFMYVREKIKTLFSVSVAVFIALMLFMYNVNFNASPMIVEKYLDRFTTIFSPEHYQKGGTFYSRIEEIKEEAFPYFKHNPLLGIGIGTKYRYNYVGWDNINRRPIYIHTGYTHNGYFAILLKMGVIGLLAFLWLIATFFIQVFDFLKRIKDEYFRYIVLSFAIVIGALLVSSIMEPYFLVYQWIPCIALSMGMIEVVNKIEKKESDEELAIPSEI